MAVNQSQVDHIITAASEDDPEVKLQNLEREVDLIKTSIKRLLMDIRERMNELENPFTLTAPGIAGAPSPGTAAMNAGIDEARESALKAREAALDARETSLDVTQDTIAQEKKSGALRNEPRPAPAAPVEERQHLLDDQVLALLRSQVAVPQKNAVPETAVPAPSPAPQMPQVLQAPVNEKLRLQKVYKLFKWTTQSVKKFGHDRLEIMLESYRAMGYITKESCDEIREISRLMPANLGEEHEVGPDEFVAELYALNRILSPGDTSLDRDMIEVMMEKRQQEPLPKEIIGGERVEFAGSSLRETRPAVKKDKDEEWMNLPDRI
jgi:hypothetical protein